MIIGAVFVLAMSGLVWGALKHESAASAAVQSFTWLPVLWILPWEPDDDFAVWWAVIVVLAARIAWGFLRAPSARGGSTPPGAGPPRRRWCGRHGRCAPSSRRAG
ncbi:hypothetical protein CUTER_01040 [Corynebacterium uterequi]|uniref:Uncharacterized protein n=1 Tax=Corynebacterium uterequi TaxID=1072256 RepID=A0A0G3HE62_9CORY|nr:hypothetical protein CUTER_01040 [Corynebacterium uterequi]